AACLLNWARARARRKPLSQPPRLARAAALKGREVLSCGRISHTPCGSDAAAPLQASGYRAAVFGENLYAAWSTLVSARRVVAAWLRSPPHRRNILEARFRHVGTAFVQAPGDGHEAQAIVWVAAFAAPR
ncbi:MAG TPA: CAP domain-containing protein, partial [Gaiellaceae bacterium]|nr:CAP domain-containing protein [Gaiellaceae bacterium]